MKLLKSVAFSLLYLLIYFYFQMTSQLVLALYYTDQRLVNFGSSAVTDMYSFATGLEEFLLSHSGFTIVFAAAVTLLLYYAILQARGLRLRSVFSLEPPRLRGLAAALFLAVGMQLLLNAVFNLPALAGVVEEYNKTMEVLLFDKSLLFVLAVVFIGPAVEEIMFRGLVLFELKKCMPAWLAILLQGILFGLYHMNPVQSLYAACVGILLGFLAYKTKSLAAAWVMHMVFNAFSFQLLSPEMGTVFYAVNAIGGILLLVGGILLLSLKKMQKPLDEMENF